MTPKISVIISTYNRPERLKKAIESVQKQTFTDWELIIVDDAGKPSEYEGAPNIHYIQLKEHFGSDTRPKNRGIQLAQADLIAFLDDDNEWRPDHLSALYKVLTNDPTLDVVYGDRWMIDETGERTPQIGSFRDFSAYHLMQKNYIDVSDVLVRKRALEYVGGFDERYRKYVDWNLWVRLHKAGLSFQRVPLILTDYHLHKDSKSMRPEDEAAPLTPAWDPLELEIRLPYLGPQEPPRVAIFSLTYNRLDYTKACFESLYKTAGYPFDHHVVDNGSTDGSVEWLNKRREGRNPDKGDPQHMFVIPNTHNVGISKGSNAALDHIEAFGKMNQFRYDIIGKVDNDAFFLTEGWLKTITQLWEKNHRLALSPYVQGLKDNPGGSAREAYGQLAGELIGMTRHVGGISIFADRKAYEGWRWDESDFLHGIQDVEFSTHLREIGYQPAYLENHLVEHYRGTEQQEKDYPEYYQQRKEEKRTRYASKEQSTGGVHGHDRQREEEGQGSVKGEGQGVPARGQG